jgi:hypothetical protein
MVCQEWLCATIGRSNRDRPTQSSATQIKPQRDMKVLLCVATSGTCARTEGPLRAVKAISCSQWNAGFGAHSGPSRGDPRRRAFRPIEAFKAAVRYVRNTCAP